MKAWEQFLSNLQDELGSPVVNKWLRCLRTVRFDAANLHLEAENPIQASWFEEHIRPRLKKNGFYNENHRPIKIHLSCARREKNQSREPIETTVANSKKLAPLFPSPSFNFRTDPLDPTCSIEHFVPSKENAIVHRIFSEWAIHSSCPFNPIFVYGAPKSGKTHLLMGAAHRLMEANKKCLYVTASTFTEHVVQAMRLGRMQEFRNIYRTTDVLLIDNVDQLSGRAATQEEFFHTFNTLHTLGKQIVLSSLIAPSKLQDIESRLISRFEWGISVKLERSDDLQILQEKAKHWNIALSKQLAAFLLETFPSDPVMALQALVVRGPSHTEISVDLAKKLLLDMLRKEEQKALTPEKVIKALSMHFGIKASDLIGKSQTREFALARQIAMYLCRQLLKMPFQAIGKLFGRDHSTVMSSTKQIQKGIDEKNASILEAIETASNHMKEH